MLSRKTRQEILEILGMLDDGFAGAPSKREVSALQNGAEAVLAVLDICRRELSVERFEYYQEALTALHDALRTLQREDNGEIIALGQELLRWLIGVMRTEPVKKEIVFLPYKASMWDSLESIWQAAVLDAENCNAHIVAIPYAALTSERKVKEWHYEKGMFPPHVPIIDYRDFDLEKFHPDVIFFHNPFDGTNLVTSVEGRYYSDKLKKYTDKLIYVPYFISGNHVAPHYVVTPGVLYADHVIVESEPVKREYEAGHPGGEPPAGKILALGSPKYDKVKNETREEHPIPEDWQRLAAGKKIFLYNTSLNAALQYSDKICSKLEYLFDVFRQRDDFIFWWRPHPLLKDSLDAMHPELSAYYRALERRYIDEGWGIYDDSPDMTRAIIWADAYYGEESSGSCLYRELGRPLLLQHLPLHEERSYRPWMPMLAYDGNTVWFVTAGNLFSGLYEMDLAADQLTCLGEIPAPYARSFEYGAIGKIGEKIVIMPWYCCGSALEYDLNQKEFKKIPLPALSWREGMAAAFSNVFRFGDSLYFIGNGNGLIVEYHVGKEQYFCHTEWAKGLSVEAEKLVFGWNVGAQVEHMVYLPIENSAGVLALDLQTMRSVIHEMPIRGAFSALSYDGESFWIVQATGNQMVRWLPSIQKAEIYEMPVPENSETPFVNSIAFKGRQLFFPAGQEKFFSVRKADQEIIHEAAWEAKYDMADAPDSPPCLMQEVGDAPRKWLVYLFSHQVLLEIDSDGGTVREHRLHIAIEESLRYYMDSEARRKSADCDEKYGLGLCDFLTIVKSHSDRSIKEKGTVGEEIYRWLKEMIM